MADKFDDKLFEDVPYQEPEAFDDSLFEDVEYGAEPAEIEPEEMGALEAGVTGFGQGASFGLTPIISGAVSAGGEVVEDIGDILGLTTDAELREQGFQIEDENKGLQGLLDAYYEGRERQKAQETKAMEDQPIAAIAGNLAGGLTSAGGAAKATGTLGQILPKAESVKDLSLAGRIGVGAREGMKAGALAGFGGGEAKLAEGELGEALEETAMTGLGGAALGGGLPIAGAAAKKVARGAKSLPGIREFGLGYKAGKEGVDILDDQAITQYIKDTSDEVRDIISRNFSGASKEQLLQEADEIGIRVAAGESVEEVIDSIKQSGAFGAKAQRELGQFVEDLKSLSQDYDPAMAKAMKGVEKSAAKKAVAAERAGKPMQTRTEVSEDIQDAAMGDYPGRVVGVEDKFKLPSGKESKKLTTAAFLEGEVPLKQYDLQNMTMSELEEVIRKVGQRGFEQTDDASTPFARELYGRLRKMSNEALESSSLPERNRKLKQMFNSLESLGIEPNDFFSSQETVRDAVQQKIANKIASGGATDFSMDNFFKYLRRADSKIADQLESKSRFAKDLSKYIQQSDAAGSVSFKSLLGPAQKAVAKVGTIPGSVVKNAGEAKRAIFKRMGDMTPDEVLELGTQLGELYGDKASPFINALRKVAEAEGPRRNALMYGMYQQPAFRKMLEDVGRSITPELEGEQPQAEVNSDFPITPESTGRTPQGDFSAPITDEEIDSLVQSEGSAAIHSKTTPYTGLTGTPNSRVEGSTDEGLYYDSLGKLTAGYGDLVTSEEEAQKKMNQSPSQALESLLSNYRASKEGAQQVAEEAGINVDELSDEQVEGLSEMVFQIGKIGTKKFQKMLVAIRDGEYERAAMEAQNSRWFEQTPNRVRKFQQKIMQAKE